MWAMHLPHACTHTRRRAWASRKPRSGFMVLVFSGARDPLRPTISKSRAFARAETGRRSCNRGNLYDGAFNRSIKTVLEYGMGPRGQREKERTARARARARTFARGVCAGQAGYARIPSIVTYALISARTSSYKRRHKYRRPGTLRTCFTTAQNENSALLTTAVFFDRAAPIRGRSLAKSMRIYGARDRARRERRGPQRTKKRKPREN